MKSEPVWNSDEDKVVAQYIDGDTCPDAPEMRVSADVTFICVPGPNKVQCFLDIRNSILVLFFRENFVEIFRENRSLWARWVASTSLSGQRTQCAAKTTASTSANVPSTIQGGASLMFSIHFAATHPTR